MLLKDIQDGDLRPGDIGERWVAGPASFQDLAGSRCELDAVEVGEVSPAGLPGIVSRLKSAAQDRAIKVDQDIVIFARAFGVGHNAFENSGDRSDGNLQPGFFQDFPGHSVFQTFAGFDSAAWKGPVAGEWRVTALDEKHLSVLIEDQRANANDRAGWIAPTAGKLGRHGH